MRNFQLNAGNDTFEIANYVAVPKSQDLEISAVQPRGSAVVLCALDVMVSAINLHDQPCSQANEVDEIAAELKLPAEADSTNTFATELAPQ